MNESRFRKELGRRMRNARIARWGPKQSACALALRVEQSQISRWESGKTVPRLTELLPFAAACGTTLDELTSGFMKPTGVQLLLGLDSDAQAAVIDLVEIIRRKTAEAGRHQARIP